MPELSRDVVRLTAVALDRVLQRERLQVVHVTRTHAQTPQRRRPQLVRSVLRWRLHDPVSGFDVMEQKIAVGMDDLVTQSLGNRETAPIDEGTGRRRHDGCDMARRAANCVEQTLAGLS